MGSTSRKLSHVALAATLFFSLFSAHSAAADNPPRKIMTGWLPYYSMKTALPDVLNNIDLIKDCLLYTSDAADE